MPYEGKGAKGASHGKSASFHYIAAMRSLSLNLCQADARGSGAGEAS